MIYNTKLYTKILPYESFLRAKDKDPKRMEKFVSPPFSLIAYAAMSG
jgi:hypothetical protein